LLQCKAFVHSKYCSHFLFPCILADIRELISLDDVMEEIGLGPNGGLIYCMEYPVI
jgi:hypothetical protein